MYTGLTVNKKNYFILSDSDIIDTLYMCRINIKSLTLHSLSVLYINTRTVLRKGNVAYCTKAEILTAKNNRRNCVTNETDVKNDRSQ